MVVTTWSSLPRCYWITLKWPHTSAQLHLWIFWVLKTQSTRLSEKECLGLQGAYNLAEKTSWATVRGRACRGLKRKKKLQISTGKDHRRFINKVETEGSLEDIHLTADTHSGSAHRNRHGFGASNLFLWTFCFTVSTKTREMVCSSC